MVLFQEVVVISFTRFIQAKKNKMQVTCSTVYLSWVVTSLPLLFLLSTLFYYSLLLAPPVFSWKHDFIVVDLYQDSFFSHKMIEKGILKNTLNIIQRHE